MSRVIETHFSLFDRKWFRLNQVLCRMLCTCMHIVNYAYAFPPVQDPMKKIKSHISSEIKIKLDNKCTYAYFYDC